jgi:hypothetical protein
MKKLKFIYLFAAIVGISACQQGMQIEGLKDIDFNNVAARSEQGKITLKDIGEFMDAKADGCISWSSIQVSDAEPTYNFGASFSVDDKSQSVEEVLINNQTIKEKEGFYEIHSFRQENSLNKVTKTQSNLWFANTVTFSVKGNDLFDSFENYLVVPTPIQLADSPNGFKARQESLNGGIILNWNMDANNKIGVIIRLAQSPNLKPRFLLVPDTGTYTLTKEDLANTVAGVLDLELHRGNYKYIITEKRKQKIKVFAVSTSMNAILLR